MGRPKVATVTDFKGFWIVKTESSDYVIDFETKQVKRMRTDDNVLNNDGDWLKFVQISIEKGKPVEMIIDNNIESVNRFTFRRTSKVVKLSKLKTPVEV